jgi:ribulose 1,5-bisphosphate synthetase/thiazole synthase
MWIVTLSVIATALSTPVTAVVEIDPSKFDAANTIQKDVVIIGGGASGAHAAVRLREDFGKSVVVVEKQSILVRGFYVMACISSKEIC